LSVRVPGLPRLLLWVVLIAETARWLAPSPVVAGYGAVSFEKGIVSVADAGGSHTDVLSLGARPSSIAVASTQRRQAHDDLPYACRFPDPRTSAEEFAPGESLASPAFSDDALRNSGVLLRPSDRFPLDVRLIDQSGGPISPSVVDGTRAYVGVGPRLHVFDLSDQERPRMVGGTSPLANNVLRVALLGNYAALAYGDTGTVGPSGLAVVDLSASDSPRVLACYPTHGRAFSMLIDGTTLYYLALASPTTLRPSVLNTFDLSTPEYPRLLTSAIVNVSPNAANVGGSDVSEQFQALRDGYGYFVDSRGIYVLDLSRPDAPVEVGQYAGERNGMLNAAALLVHGPYLYVSANRVTGRPTRPIGRQGGLQILDVSDITNPRRVSWNYDDAGAMAIIGETLYVSFQGSEGPGVRLLDVSNPRNPHEIETCLSGVVPSTSPIQIASSRGTARIVDASEPCQPVHLATIRFPGSSYAVSSANPQYAYGVDTANGFTALDVSEPWSLSVVGWGGRSAPIEQSSAVGPAGYAYVYEIRDSKDWLVVIDISNPRQLVRVNQVALPGRAAAMAVSGDILYVLITGPHRLEVLDLSDPATPVRAAGLGVSDATRMVVKDGRAYLLRTSARSRDRPDLADPSVLTVVDLGDPERPTIVTSRRLPFRAESLALSDRFAYVVSLVDIGVSPLPEPELAILDLAELSIGTETVIPWRGGPHVTIADGYLLGTGAPGSLLSVFSLDDPRSPIEVGRFGDAPRARGLRAPVVAGRDVYIGTDRGLWVLCLGSYQ
jgi:hypothetical protein